MTNKRNGTLYTGVTSDLQRHVREHRTHAKLKRIESMNPQWTDLWEEIKDGNNEYDER